MTQRIPKWLLNFGKNGDQEKGFMIQGVRKILPDWKVEKFSGARLFNKSAAIRYNYSFS